LTPLEELNSAPPDSLAGFKRAYTTKRREEKGRKARRRKGKGRRGGEGKGLPPSEIPNAQNTSYVISRPPVSYKQAYKMTGID